MKRINPEFVYNLTRTPLKDLCYLNLDDMGLESINGLEVCCNLTTLSLHGNKLENIGKPITFCRELWNIDLSKNMLTDVEGLETFLALGTLNLSNNQLTFASVRKLAHVNILDLYLQGNKKLAEKKTLLQYQKAVVGCVPNAWVVDGDYIAVGLRVKSLRGWKLKDDLGKCEFESFGDSETPRISGRSKSTVDKALWRETSENVAAECEDITEPSFSETEDIQRHKHSSAQLELDAPSGWEQTASSFATLPPEAKHLLSELPKPDLRGKKDRVLFEPTPKDEAAKREVLKEDFFTQQRKHYKYLADFQSAPVGKAASNFLQQIAHLPPKPGQLDTFRLSYLLRFYEDGANVQQRGTYFQANGKKTNAYPSPNFRKLKQLDKSTQIDLLVLLCASIEFDIPTKILSDSLWIVIGGHQLNRGEVQDVTYLPMFIKTAVIHLLLLDLLDEVGSTEPHAHQFTFQEQDTLNTIPKVLTHANSTAQTGNVDEGLRSRARNAVILLGRSPACPTLSKVQVNSSDQKKYNQLLPIINAGGFGYDDLNVEEIRPAKDPARLPWNRTEVARNYKRDWAVAKKNEQNTDNPIQCKGGHTLTEDITPHDQRRCNACHENIPIGSPSRSCRECDFDVCISCFGPEKAFFFQKEDVLNDVRKRWFPDDLEDTSGMDALLAEMFSKGSGFGESDNKTSQWEADEDIVRKWKNVRMPKESEMVEVHASVFVAITGVEPDGCHFNLMPFEKMSELPLLGNLTIAREDILWDPRGWWIHVHAVQQHRQLQTSKSSVRLHRTSPSLKRSGLPSNSGTNNVKIPLQLLKELQSQTLPKSLSSLQVYTSETSWDPAFVMAPPLMISLQNQLSNNKNSWQSIETKPQIYFKGGDTPFVQNITATVQRLNQVSPTVPANLVYQHSNDRRKSHDESKTQKSLSDEWYDLQKSMGSFKKANRATGDFVAAWKRGIRSAEENFRRESIKAENNQTQAPNQEASMTFLTGIEMEDNQEADEPESPDGNVDANQIPMASSRQSVTTDFCPQPPMVSSQKVTAAPKMNTLCAEEMHIIEELKALNMARSKGLNRYNRVKDRPWHVMPSEGQTRIVVGEMKAQRTAPVTLTHTRFSESARRFMRSSPISDLNYSSEHNEGPSVLSPHTSTQQESSTSPNNLSKQQLTNSADNTLHIPSQLLSSKSMNTLHMPQKQPSSATIDFLSSHSTSRIEVFQPYLLPPVNADAPSNQHHQLKPTLKPRSIQSSVNLPAANKKLGYAHRPGSPDMGPWNMNDTFTIANSLHLNKT